MAAAGTPRPGRTLAIVAAVVIALYLGLFLGPSQSPRLGLDLRGGTQVTLAATPLQGGTVTKGALNQAVNIIRQRVDAAGVGGAQITTQGNQNIVVSAPGANGRQLNALDQTALLNFRQVLAVGPYTSSPATAPSATPSGSPSAKATTSPAPKATTKKSSSKTKKSSGDALRASLMAPAKAKRSASPSPTPSPSTTASAQPTPSASASPGATKGPANGTASPDLKTVQQAFAGWDCAKNDNPTEGLDAPNDYIVACDNSTDATYKYLLAPAEVKGQDIKSASAGIDSQTNEWIVEVSFKSSGPWLSLTQKAAKQPDVPNCSPPSGCNAVAIVLDGVVQSAPKITDPNGIPGGRAQITGGAGGFSQDEANTLANVLKFGALPLKLTKLQTTSVSASLGSDQLRGGLIAGAIGLFLVIVYSLLYYRALGLVTIASLAISGAILYAVTTLLGHSALGYTLSLPGIAGFIVAVGITADSFVVFFERIRDEVREGRRLRSAVERAWPRARRTIISADAVSLLAAVVLYIVSIGDVRGFAFTLGLSTISDLFIVFFFTKPLLSVLARTKTFDSGHGWTGVGGTKPAPTLAPKEA